MEHPVVVISDDDAHMVRALTRQATLAGMWAVPDLTSDVAEMARQVNPAVVILDIDQRRNGVELLEQLKTDPRTCQIKVIMLTGNDDAALRERCRKLGADEYVLKPCDSTFIIRVAKLAAEVNRDRYRSTGSRWSRPIH